MTDHVSRPGPKVGGRQKDGGAHLTKRGISRLHHRSTRMPLKNGCRTFLSSDDLGLFVHHCSRRWSRRSPRKPTNPFTASALMDGPWKLDHPVRIRRDTYLTAARVRSTFISQSRRSMSHAGNASKSIAVFLKLAAMLRIVRAVQFIFNKLAALLRGKGSDEMRASEFIGEASCITRSAVDQHATQSSSDHAIAGRKRTTSQIEKS